MSLKANNKNPLLNKKGIEIINLPHPSGQNNRIWYRSKKDKYEKKIEETDREIRKLIELCKGIH